ncbi:MAG TPA: SGNH/GDSL hydrolase family protein, partial [Daejeonella sp.]|nr:SGNH/GDSL hydrolase family protein [Daejeonella sp.]
ISENASFSIFPLSCTMKPIQPSRRSFITKVAFGSLAAVSIPEIVLAAIPEARSSKISLEKNDVVLFQGDSITDAGRNRKTTDANIQNGLGGGYAFLAASDLLQNNPTKNLQIFNRGVSGNKVYQLAESWDKDALDLKPDVLSILVGVNDYWHTLSFGYKATVDTYRKDYRALLLRTKDKLPDVKLIIGEPFAVIGTAVTKAWFPAFNEYRVVARELATEFNAAFVPYQSVFDKALKVAPGAYWCPDGVHPSVAGAKLMAEAWLKTVK